MCLILKGNRIGTHTIVFIIYVWATPPSRNPLPRPRGRLRALRWRCALPRAGFALESSQV